MHNFILFNDTNKIVLNFCPIYRTNLLVKSNKNYLLEAHVGLV